MRDPTFPTPEALAEKTEKIKSLEFLDRGDKVDIILVLYDQKPSSEVELWYVPSNPSKTQEEFDERVRRFARTLDECGLAYVLTTQITSFGDTRADFSIAKNHDGAEALAATDFIEDEAERYKQRGRLLGVPQTAVDAFPEDVFSIDETPEEVGRTEGFGLVGFRPSRDHWEEEFAVAKERLALIKQVAPEFLAEGEDQEKS